MSRHPKLFEIPDAQWEGNAPFSPGREWVINDHIQVAEQYACYFGGGDVVDVDGDGDYETVVSGEIRIDGKNDGTTFLLWGYHTPRLQITNAKTGLHLDSETDAPRLFDPYFKKYLGHESFQNRFGQLFIARIGDCLNYQFQEPGGIINA